MKTAIPFLSSVLVALLAAGCADAPASGPSTGEHEAGLASTKGAPDTVDPSREIMITDLSVVEDPLRTVYPAGGRHGSAQAGAWTFGALVENMANSTDPAVVSDFVVHLLRQWNTDQTVNGFTAPARPTMETAVIEPWLQKSGGVTLDMQYAPFRLLAVSNRIDLRNSTLAKKDPSFNAGEGRFVFGVLDATGAKALFTVIFEYGITTDFSKNKHTAKGQDVQEWANAWHALGSVPFGSAYNDKLQAITDRFSGPNCPWKPNANCLNQFRTNEVILGAPGSDPKNSNGKLWELREFHLSDATGLLEQATIAEVPDASFNGSAALAATLNTPANQAAARSGTFDVPTSMLAASDPAPFGGVWTAPGVPSDVRFGFASNTCNGCHTTETGTVFLHVKPRLPGQASALSGFLSGITVKDPVTGEPRSFSALRDRADNLLSLVNANAKDLEGQKQDNKAD